MFATAVDVKPEKTTAAVLPELNVEPAIFILATDKSAISVQLVPSHDSFKAESPGPKLPPVD